MNLPDYEPPARPIDDMPDPRASQRVAAQKRSFSPTDDERPTTNAPRPALPMAAGMVVIILAMIGMAAWQLSRTLSKPLQFPTTAPAPAFEMDSKTSYQASPAPTAATPPTEAPHSTPVPTEAVLAAPDAPAQTGRGLTIENAVPTPEQAAASDYIANVGAQAEHSPRGDGQPGPDGGDWALVPTAEPQYLANVGAQKPHVVR